MRTLYEDWQMRRERLRPCASSAHFTEQTRVFDYLLARYADDPVARQEARFPLHSELAIDTRAILVHHHMALREFGGTRTVAEAHTRARNILAHISKVDPQASIQDPGWHMFAVGEKRFDGNGPLTRDMSLKRELPLYIVALCARPISIFVRVVSRSFSGEVHRKIWNDAKMRLGLLPRALAENNPRWVESLCHLSLSAWPESFHPALAEDVVDALFAMAANSDFEKNTIRSDAILGVLERCRNVGVIHAYIRCWTENIGSKLFRARIREFLRKQGSRCADFVRMQLTGDSPLARARAANLLSDMGDLHDIGMFQDLLALREVQMEWDERDAYLQAMRVLSGIK